METEKEKQSEGRRKHEEDKKKRLEAAATFHHPKRASGVMLQLYTERIEEALNEILPKYAKGFQNINPEEEWVIGIDEAGRGPVLGPMVYGVLFYPKSMEKYFLSTMFDDSKKLVEEVRDLLYN